MDELDGHTARDAIVRHQIGAGNAHRGVAGIRRVAAAAAAARARARLEGQVTNRSPPHRMTCASKH